MEIKICTVCKIEKPLSEFYKQKVHSKKKGTHYIYKSECKQCGIEASKERIYENYDEFKAYLREYDKQPKVRKQKTERQRKYVSNGGYSNWQKENPDKISQYNQDRQHKNHDITKNEWISCKEYFNNSCAYCELPIDKHYRKYAGVLQKIDLHKEHVDHEGTNDLSNCISSCMKCNDRKWKFKFEEWYNKNNPVYTEERYKKIVQWLENDYKNFIE